MNTTTNIQQGYADLKSRLAALIGHLEEPLNKAALLLGTPRADELGKLREQLEQDLFSLVLIGAFQSGKSTLFNYLCDGRELSPVGPNGGGIRTSGCRVTAHPLPEGAPEKALIHWRTPGELLLSLGGCLCAAYCDRCSKPYLTEDVVDLHDPAQREELSQHAWELLLKPEISLKDDEEELLYFALLLCRYFPQYEQWRQQSEYSDFSAMLKLTSYPQDWASLWSQARVTRDLSPFEGRVHFLFIGGVDLYLDSPPLRQLGCSVTDCPGLFISPWDSRIAEKCIREAHAILYLFSGDKSLTAADLTALKFCRDKSGSSRLIFGANLRVAEGQWDRIAAKSVIPVLKDKGFPAPQVHPFHSGMALRARERMQLHYDLLDANSAAAIDLNMELDANFKRRDDAQEDRRRYLETRQLRPFLASLSGWSEELEDYPPTDDRLEQRSGVPRFIAAAKDFVVERRASGILRDRGTKVVLRALNTTHAALEAQRSALAEDAQQARARIERARGELGELRQLGTHAMENINNAISTQGRALQEWAQQVVCDELNKREARCKAVFLKYKPSMVGALIKSYDLNAFKEEMTGVMLVCLLALQQRLAAEAATLAPLCSLREVFTYEQRRLSKDVAEMKWLQLPDMADLPFPDNWEQTSAQLILPSSDALQDMLTPDNNVWEWFKTIVTFGVRMLFKNSNSHAAAFWKKHAETFRQGLRRAVVAIMEAEDGTVGCLRTCAAQYQASIDSSLAQAQQRLAGEEAQLNALLSSEERQARVQQLGAMAADFAGCIREAENLQGEVDDFLR